MNNKTDIDIDIVIRYLEDPDNEQHKQALNDWIQADTGNLDIFLDMKAMWQGDALPTASPYDIQAQWDQLNAVLDATPATTGTAPQQGRIVPLTRKYWWAAAAAVVAIALTWTWLGPGSYQTFATATQQDSLLLPDGSKVYLNAHTSIRYARRFGQTNRNIRIDKGEAFFDVTRNETVPFIVNAPEVEVQVLGTAFNVKAASSGVKVFVQSGKVSAAYKGTEKKVILTPGVEASLQHNGTNIDTQLHKKSNNILAWKTRCLTFDDTPLAEVATSLADFYGVEISLSNPALSDKKLLATFRNMPLDEVLDIMRKTLQINITHKNNLVEIY
ncbi:FecR family protein [Chitinophaga nivalis]|uniref:FecR domain-containing protein n=1 Tax=Chitinophaga nivalis TaxID=2991709 RepID=A0ABT3IL77_9BACT|nr:FecR domain-containing protein [Chitinophaga nivalis]MCW3465583.1 FecR domain-containing protein [Chitinophaga nivalis]MCW3484726.1 FecR domain-containing protein [Chitinophaga nivalis]